MNWACPVQNRRYNQLQIGGNELHEQETRNGTHEHVREKLQRLPDLG